MNPGESPVYTEHTHCAAISTHNRSTSMTASAHKRRPILICLPGPSSAGHSRETPTWRQLYGEAVFAGAIRRSALGPAMSGRDEIITVDGFLQGTAPVFFSPTPRRPRIRTLATEHSPSTPGFHLLLSSAWVRTVRPHALFFDGRRGVAADNTATDS